MAIMVQGMHAMYHDLCTSANIGNASQKLEMVKKALKNLGSSARCAVPSLLEEQQSLDCRDRMGLPTNKLAKANVWETVARRCASTSEITRR